MVAHAIHMVDGSSLPCLYVFRVVSLHRDDRHEPAGSRVPCRNGLVPRASTLQPDHHPDDPKSSRSPYEIVPS